MDRSEKRFLLKNYPGVFDNMVSRLGNSPNPDEQGRLFMGFAVDGQHPVFVPRQKLLEHAHLLGTSGSGTTTRGMIPLLTQVIAAADSTAIIFDADGNRALFETARIEAQRAGLPFKWFTNVGGSPSYIWNPLQDPFYRERLNPVERAQLIVSGFGLDHGESLWRGFFTASMKMLASRLIEKYASAIHSLRDLYRFCDDKAAYQGLGPSKDFESSRHLVGVLHAVSLLTALQATEQTAPSLEAWKNRITAEAALSSPSVIYVLCPAAVESSAATCITRLFLHSLIAAAATHPTSVPRNDVYCFIDHAEHVATQGLPLILSKAHGLRIGCILAHHSLDQLRLNGEHNLIDLVLSATAVKQVFRTADLLSRRYLSETSGEGLFHQLSWSQPMEGNGAEPSEHLLGPNAGRNWFSEPKIKVQEILRPRLEPNTILDASSDESMSLVSFSGDHGPVSYGGAWTPVVSGYIMPESEYKRRLQAPWPGATTATVLNSQTGDMPREASATLNGSSERNSITRRFEDGLKQLAGENGFQRKENL